MTYKTIKNIEQVIIKEKKSKFIGYAYNVENEQEIKEKLETIKIEHSKATHHCYAYKLGLDNTNFRANDDGEPTGTAGKPILNQINSLELTNCLVVVVRYFGGIKLGTSGLIDAYKLCAKETLALTEIIEKDIQIKYQFCSNFNDSIAVYDFLKRYKINFQQDIIDDEIEFIVNLKTEQQLLFEEFLKQQNLLFKIL